MRRTVKSGQDSIFFSYSNFFLVFYHRIHTVSLLPPLLNVILFCCHQNNGEKMAPLPILFVIHIITIALKL